MLMLALRIAAAWTSLSFVSLALWVLFLETGRYLQRSENLRGRRLRGFPVYYPSIMPQQGDEEDIGGHEPLASYVPCDGIWLAECGQGMSAQRNRAETNCRQCDELLEQYVNAVEAFSLAVKDYWTDGAAESFVSVTPEEQQRILQTVTDCRNALMQHYASCADREATLLNAA